MFGSPMSEHDWRMVNAKGAGKGLKLADARLRLANETEAERRRIAREIHDHVGQQLTGVQAEGELAVLVGQPLLVPAAVTLEHLAPRRDRQSAASQNHRRRR